MLFEMHDFRYMFHLGKSSILLYVPTFSTIMGQRISSFRAYGHGSNRKSAWTALACGAALMSDGIPISKYLTIRIFEQRRWPSEYHLFQNLC
jgi:hypothetical protein